MTTASSHLHSVKRAGSDTSERRFDRRSRLVLVLALLLFFVGMAQKTYRFSLPTTGWSNVALDSGRRVFQRNLLDKPSSLQAGDSFVALEGVPFKALDTGASETFSNFRASQAVEMHVRRGGALVNLEVPLYHWTLAAIFRAFLLSLQSNYAGYLALFIAIFLFWQRPKNLAVQLLFLFFVTNLTIHISRLASPLSLTDLLFPPAYLLAVYFSYLGYIFLLSPLTLHLFLSFPERKALLVRHPWLPWLFYGLPWALTFVTLRLDSLGSAKFQSTLIITAGIYALGSALAFAHTFVTARDPVHRAQVRWVAFGFAVSSLGIVIWTLHALGLLRAPSFFHAFSAPPSQLILALSLAVAVLRYRLFDVDLAINRTLVYGALSACVVGLYVLVVGSLGTLLHAKESIAVSLVATGLIAVLFQPLRERLQRSVNRLMYGQREEPYALLARLSRKVEGTLTPGEMLPEMLETVTQALKLPCADIIFYQGESDEVVTRQGPPVGPDAVVFPLVHQGETFGALRLGPRGPGESFTPAELHLLATIARQISVAAHTVRQTAALQRSRERLTRAREEERLRIRRDLHDGLGPTLAGLNLQAGLLKGLIRRNPEAAVDAVTDLSAGMRRASGEIRQLVYDLRPPSLDQLGLAGALRQLTEGFNQPGSASVAADIPELPCLPAATEVAVYRIVQEALTNAFKHAEAEHVCLLLRQGRELELTVSDDGKGFPEHYRAGVGLRSMRERAEELGGALKIHTGNNGAEIRATLPMPVP